MKIFITKVELGLMSLCEELFNIRMAYTTILLYLIINSLFMVIGMNPVNPPPSLNMTRPLLTPSSMVVPSVKLFSNKNMTSIMLVDSRYVITTTIGIKNAIPGAPVVTPTKSYMTAYVMQFTDLSEQSTDYTDKRHVSTSPVKDISVENNSEVNKKVNSSRYSKNVRSTLVTKSLILSSKLRIRENTADLHSIAFAESSSRGNNKKVVSTSNARIYPSLSHFNFYVKSSRLQAPTLSMKIQSEIEQGMKTSSVPNINNLSSSVPGTKVLIQPSSNTLSRMTSHGTKGDLSNISTSLLNNPTKNVYESKIAPTKLTSLKMSKSAVATSSVVEQNIKIITSLSSTINTSDNIMTTISMNDRRISPTKTFQPKLIRTLSVIPTSKINMVTSSDIRLNSTYMLRPITKTMSGSVKRSIKKISNALSTSPSVFRNTTRIGVAPSLSYISVSLSGSSKMKTVNTAPTARISKSVTMVSTSITNNWTLPYTYTTFLKTLTHTQQQHTDTQRLHLRNTILTSRNTLVQKHTQSLMHSHTSSYTPPSFSAHANTNLTSYTISSPVETLITRSATFVPFSLGETIIPSQASSISTAPNISVVHMMSSGIGRQSIGPPTTAAPVLQSLLTSSKEDSLRIVIPNPFEDNTWNKFIVYVIISDRDHIPMFEFFIRQSLDVHLQSLPASKNIFEQT